MSSKLHGAPATPAALRERSGGRQVRTVGRMGDWWFNAMSAVSFRKKSVDRTKPETRQKLP
jgi:hypothetical protein